MKRAAATRDRVGGARPAPPPAPPPHRCRAKAVASPQTRPAAAARGDPVPTPQRGGDAPAPRPERRFPARRGVIERTNPWPTRFRQLKIRDEKTTANDLGLIHFACFLMVYRLRRVLG